jgi:hypothetical protein
MYLVISIDYSVTPINRTAFLFSTKEKAEKKAEIMRYQNNLNNNYIIEIDEDETDLFYDGIILP